MDSDDPLTEPVYCGYCNKRIWLVNSGVWASYMEDEYEWSCPRNEHLNHDPWARRIACRDLVRVLRS